LNPKRLLCKAARTLSPNPSAACENDLNTSRSKFKRKYKIIKKIGEGTEGKVYLAVTRNTGENVAVKFITNLRNHLKLKAILREVKILKELS